MPIANNKKKMYVAIGGLVGLIVLIVAAVLVIPMLLGVSKEQYKTAYDIANDSRSNYSKAFSTYVSTYGTETEFENKLDTIKTNLDEFNSKVGQLGDTVAVQRDDEVNQAYQAMIDKKADFDKAMSATTEAYAKILPAVLEVRDIDSDDPFTSIAAIRKSFDSISGLNSQVNKDFVASMEKTLPELEKISKEVSSWQDNPDQYDSSVMRKFRDSSRNMTDSIRDWSSNLQKLAEKGDISDEFNSLGQLLADKVRETE